MEVCDINHRLHYHLKFKNCLGERDFTTAIPQQEEARVSTDLVLTKFQGPKWDFMTCTITTITMTE